MCRSSSTKERLADSGVQYDKTNREPFGLAWHVMIDTLTNILDH